MCAYAPFHSLIHSRFLAHPLSLSLFLLSPLSQILPLSFLLSVDVIVTFSCLSHSPRTSWLYLLQFKSDYRMHRIKANERRGRHSGAQIRGDDLQHDQQRRRRCHRLSKRWECPSISFLCPTNRDSSLLKIDKIEIE